MIMNSMTRKPQAVRHSHCLLSSRQQTVPVQKRLSHEKVGRSNLLKTKGLTPLTSC